MKCLLTVVLYINRDEKFYYWPVVVPVPKLKE
jgi:hypothetical protein